MMVRHERSVQKLWPTQFAAATRVRPVLVKNDVARKVARKRHLGWAEARRDASARCERGCYYPPQEISNSSGGGDLLFTCCSFEQQPSVVAYFLRGVITALSRAFRRASHSGSDRDSNLTARALLDYDACALCESHVTFGREIGRGSRLRLEPR